MHYVVLVVELISVVISGLFDYVSALMAVLRHAELIIVGLHVNDKFTFSHIFQIEAFLWYTYHILTKIFTIY